MNKRLLAVAGCMLTALLTAPAASAHNTVETDDGAYFLTVGHRNEPTATFLRSGLDLIVRENDNGERGDEVPGLADQLEATLISPSGEEFSQPLELQFGSTGRYTFGDPYVLTEPGQYQLRLVGTIGDTAVDGLYDVSDPLEAIGEFTFPRSDVPTPLELQDQMAQLEARITELETEVEHLEEHADDTTAASRGIPGFMPVLAVGAVLALALVRRRSA